MKGERNAAIFSALLFCVLMIAGCASLDRPDPPRSDTLPGYRYTEIPTTISPQNQGVIEWCSGPNRIFYSPLYGDVFVTQNDAQCNGGSG